MIPRDVDEVVLREAIPHQDFNTWNPKFSIREPDVILAEQSGTLKSVRIVKNGQEFYMFVQLSWLKDQDFFFSTTRSKKEPRRFRHIGRLLEYIEKNFQSIKAVTIEIYR